MSEQYLDQVAFLGCGFACKRTGHFSRTVVDDYLKHIADLAPKEIRHQDILAIEHWNDSAETGAQDAPPDTIYVLGEQHRPETGTDLSKTE